ncbi:hypothetical protein AB0I16_24275 [Streptomyces sp. NPDC050703]|uniref:hypothetical protein n=1 Tax=Streptomyces sp. NPDC050703 TaxID=3157218 RepID=UPI00343B5C16
MLALRLGRRARPLVQLRRLFVATASAGTGFLLLCTLAYAMEHPGAGAFARLAWCVAPVTASVYFAVAVARTDPGTKPRAGLSRAGLGPARLTVLAAISTAVACALGSMVALLVFLHLRGDLSGLPFDGAAAGLLAAKLPLPLGAVLTLLTVVPVTASAVTALALRPRPAKGSATSEDARADEPSDTPAPPPGGLPWGIAVLAAGLAVETYAGRSPGGSGFRLPGGAAGNPAGVLGGWALTALGLALAGPGLTYLCGRLLQAARPGAVRLLAGRVLQEEARRIGRPLGVLCAVASGAYASVVLYAEPRTGVGPLTALGALLVTGCAVLTLATAAVETRQSRTRTTQTLLRFGAPATALRGSAALRAAALTALFAPLTWAVAELAALPLTR